MSLPGFRKYAHIFALQTFLTFFGKNGIAFEILTCRYLTTPLLLEKQWLVC